MAIVRNTRLAFDTLTAAIAANGTMDNCKVHLYKNDIELGAQDLHSEFTLPEATGLLAQTVTWSDISDDNADGYTVVSGLHEFRRGNDSDDSETFLGLIVYQQSGYDEYMRFAQEFEQPITLASTLDAIRIVLKFGEGLSAEVSCAVIE